MNFIKAILKAAVVTKVIQIAERELRKPENQQKIKDAVGKLRKKP